MNLKNLLPLSALLLLLFAWQAAAQPTCLSTFSAFETCYHYDSKIEYVFVGQVVSLEEVTSHSLHQYKAVVAIKESLKGELDSAKVELTMPRGCAGLMEKNRPFIFTAERANTSEFTGLYSSRWSTPLDIIPEADLTKLLDKIRAVIRRIPQPRLVGLVTARGWYPEGMPYLRRGWLNAQLGYDLGYGHPLAGITVVAQDKKGKQATAQTDDRGYFQFDKLPPGKYEVLPLLPDKTDIYAQGYSLLKEGEKAQIEIDDRLCSMELNFDAKRTGVVSGRLWPGKGARESSPSLSLFWVEWSSWGGTTHLIGYSNQGMKPDYVRRVSKSGAFYEFSFSHVPVGLYCIEYLVDPSKDLHPRFYPAVRDYHQATPIKVEVGKRTQIVIKFDPFAKEPPHQP